MDPSEHHVLLLAGRFEVRGSCAYTLRLAEHLREGGISTSIVSPDARLLDSDERRRLNVSEYRHLLLPGWRHVVQRLFERDVKQNPPHLLHIQSRGMLGLGTWLARRLRTPFLLTVHDTLSGRERLTVDRIWCKQVIAVSEAVREGLESRSDIPPELISVIHSGVEVSVETEGLPVLDPGHVPVVGTAGPLEAVKGLPFFLGAAHQVLESHPEVEFLVSGAGPEEHNLRRMARELGLSERVTFVPNMRDFSAPLQAMDVFVLPSLQQGLGTIMLQAMALGKPVIATGVGGVYSVVADNETALMVPPSDSERLAAAINRFLDDPALARRIGAAGQRVVQDEFGVEKMVARTIEVYERIFAEIETASIPD